MAPAAPLYNSSCAHEVCSSCLLSVFSSKLKHQNFIFFSGSRPPRSKYSPADSSGGPGFSWIPDHQPLLRKQTTAAFKAQLLAPAFPLLFRVQPSLWSKDLFLLPSAVISPSSPSLFSPTRMATFWIASRKVGLSRATPALTWFHLKQQGRF